MMSASQQLITQIEKSLFTFFLIKIHVISWDSQRKGAKFNYNGSYIPPVYALLKRKKIFISFGLISLFSHLNLSF